MKLTKTTTETLEASWCRKDWLVMGPEYRSIRGVACHWCDHEFKDGESMAVASTTKGNKTLCGRCADELIASEFPKMVSGTSELNLKDVIDQELAKLVDAAANQRGLHDGRRYVGYARRRALRKIMEAIDASQKPKSIPCGEKVDAPEVSAFIKERTEFLKRSAKVSAGTYGCVETRD